MFHGPLTSRFALCRVLSCLLASAPLDALVQYCGRTLYKIRLYYCNTLSG